MHITPGSVISSIAEPGVSCFCAKNATPPITQHTQRVWCPTCARRQGKPGFTLLELIVVLLVLGILAAIAVPTFNTVKTNSVKRTALSNAQAIARNANAISASEAGGVTTADHVDAAGLEAAGSGYDLSIDGVWAISGSISCSVTIEIVSGQAVITTDGSGDVVYGTAPDSTC